MESVFGNLLGIERALSEIALAITRRSNYRCYPVGSEYTNYTDSRDPSIILDMPNSSWTAIAGRVTVGLDSSQTEFNAPLKTGGHKLMQAHTHLFKWRVNFIRSTAGFGTNDLGGDAMLVSDNMPGGDTGAGYDWSGGADGNRSTGGGNAENLQPYIVAYKWYRTA